VEERRVAVDYDIYLIEDDWTKASSRTMMRAKAGQP